MRNLRLTRTILLVSALTLILVAVVPAQDRYLCSAAGVAGRWGYTETGTLVLPTGTISFAAVGRVVFDAAGNAQGTQTSSTGGKISEETIKGTFKINPDCTGTMTVGIYDQSGTLLRTAALNLVIDEIGMETRGVVTSLTLPNGVSLGTVLLLEAKRQFLGHSW